MDLLERLGTEHARICRVLDALDLFAEEIVGDAVDLHETIRFVTFFRGYADGLHHAREETVLLPCLVSAGFAADAGPLAYIRDQHRKEASLLFELEKAVSAPSPWGSEQRAAIALAAHAFSAFERLHMREEGALLFPVARKELASLAEKVRDADARFDRTRARRWDVRWLEALGDELIAAHARVPMVTQANE